MNWAKPNLAPSEFRELVACWFQIGYRRKTIAKRTGLSLEYIDECIRELVKPGGRKS